MAATLITSSLLILVILIIRKVFHGKMNLQLQYAMWLLVVARLLLFQIDLLPTSFSVMNFFDDQKIQSPQENLVTAQIAAEQAIAEHAITEQTIAEYALPMQKIIALIATAQTVLGEMVQGWSWKTTLICINIVGSIIFILWLMAYNLFFIRNLRKRRIPYLPIEPRKAEPRKAETQKENSFKTYNFSKTYNSEKYPLKVYVINGIKSPFLYGGSVYITPEIAENEEMKRHALTHEYSHYLQHDELWSWVRIICLVCYWYNPLVWVAAFISKQDCELACDNRSINLLGEDFRYSYARTLLLLFTRTNISGFQYQDNINDLIPNLTVLNMTTSMNDKSNHCKYSKERIAMIAKKAGKRSPTRRIITVITTVIVVMVLAITILSTFSSNNYFNRCMIVYFEQDTAETQKDEIGAAIQQYKKVSKLEYTSAEEAWAEFSKTYLKNNANIFTENPLENADSFTVYFKKNTNINELRDYIENLKGVRIVIVNPSAY